MLHPLLQLYFFWIYFFEAAVERFALPERIIDAMDKKG